MKNTPQQNALIDIESELSEAEACIDRAITSLKKTWPKVLEDSELIRDLRGLLGNIRDDIADAQLVQLDAYQETCEDND